MVSFDLDGHTFEVDEGAARSYRVAKLFARSDADASLAFDAMEELFPDGRDEEYIAALGGDSAQMARLCTAAFEAVSGAKK